ncbi:hypothetical protein NQ176_g4947 [Zarea fungicola]|uniref:Uncharacterized protein n=1 Tax=Zarea fungicola TaxID=93591 RepID=A0ACC1NAW2_9HYPO|nr:hypothetical protein NQ176_g4947 [Lecanicillium fungicola]
MVIRALRAARDAATGLLDVQKHQCYDKAFLQLATDLIAEAEIILAHSQAEDMKKVVRRFQKGVEAVRSDYPSKIGAIIVWMYSDEDIIAEDTPLEVATMLDLYTRALRVLSDAKQFFCDTLFPISIAMVQEETAQYEHELIALHASLSAIMKEEERLLRTGESRSGCLQDQKEDAMNRARQILVRIEEIQAAQEQPESLVHLMFY